MAKMNGGENMTNQERDREEMDRWRGRKWKATGQGKVWYGGEHTHRRQAKDSGRMDGWRREKEGGGSSSQVSTSLTLTLGSARQCRRRCWLLQ